MSQVRIAAQRNIYAPADRVYRIIADYRNHHPHILPPAFSNYSVEEGGVGAGTVIRFSVRAGGRTTAYHQRVEEPEPGRVLVERAIDGDLATTFTVAPAGDGCRVEIETRWTPRGVQGVAERMFAPRLMRPLYEDELARLDRYAQEEHADL